eukprot:49772-Chlamydomonas_euryale.AAC.1
MAHVARPHGTPRMLGMWHAWRVGCTWQQLKVTVWHTTHVGRVECMAHVARMAHVAHMAHVVRMAHVAHMVPTPRTAWPDAVLSAWCLHQGPQGRM